MLRTLLQTTLMTVVMAAAPLTVCAADVGESMDAMMLDYARFNRATTLADADKALIQLRAAAVDARQAKPARMSDEPANSPKLRAYQAEMDKLIAQIDKTKALVKQGQLPQAKTEGQKLMQLRTEGHKLFR